jgi:excisionase family DNA binding protein
MQSNSDNPFVSIRNDIGSVRQDIQELRQLIQATKAETPKYFSIAETAKLSNTAEITIRRGVEKGTIPSKRIGTRILIPASFFSK